MQQDPQGQGTQQPGNMPPNGGTPMGGQYPQTRSAGGGLGETMRRRVAVPVWGIAVTGLVLVCMLCGLMSAMTKGSGSSSGNQTNTSSNTSGQTVKATHTPAPTATPTHTPKWTTVQSFNGNGSKKTGTFTVPDDWKLVWSCDPSTFYGGQYNVIVTVYGSDGSMLDLAVNTICKSGNTGDTTEEHQGGDVYLDINSEAAWKIQVQVLK